MTLPVSIDSLKSTLSRRGGIARNNRFAIYLAHPGGKSSLLNNDIQSLVGNAARTTIAGAQAIGGLTTNSVTKTAMDFLKGGFNDPRDMFILCDSVNLPGRQITTSEVNDGSMITHKMPYSFVSDDVTMTYTVTNDYYAVKFWKSWMDMIIPQNAIKDQAGYKINYKDQYTTDVIIQQMGLTDFIPVYSIKLNNAYPISISPIELSNQTDNSVVQIQVTLTYENWYELDLVETARELGRVGQTIGEDTVTAVNQAVNQAGNIPLPF